MNKKTSIQSGALALLVVIAGIVWYRTENLAGASDLQARPSATYKPMSVENPRIHWERLTDSQEAEYESAGRDVFNWQLPAPAPLPAIHIPQPGDADYIAPQAPPPPPPKLPLKFFGIATDSKGRSRRAFLTDGDEVFVVAEGDTVLSHFRVLRITTATVEFEDIGSGRRVSKSLEEPSPGS